MALQVAFLQGLEVSEAYNTLTGLTDYLNRTINANFHTGTINHKYFLGNISTGTLFEKFDCYFGQFEMAYFPNVMNLTYSPAIEFSDTVIISGRPLNIEMTVFTSLLVFDAEVVALITVCLVAFAFSMAWMKEIFSNPEESNLSPKHILFGTSWWMWNLFVTFFQNSISSIPKRSSARITSLTWLFLSFFIVILTGSLLKSKFSTSEDLKLDELKDLTHYPKIKLHTLEGPNSGREFVKWKAKRDGLPEFIYKDLDDNGTFIELFDTFNEKLYVEINNWEKTIVFSRTYFKIFFCMATKNKHLDLEIYFSAKPLFSTPVGFMLNANISTDIKEQMAVRLMVNMESEPFGNDFKKCQYKIVSWVEPIPDVPTMTLSDFKGVIVLLGFGYALAIGVLFLELVYFKSKLANSQKPKAKRRKRTYETLTGLLPLTSLRVIKVQ